MAILYFSDVLCRVGLDPAKVKLIRHALTDPGFKACYNKGVSAGDMTIGRYLSATKGPKQNSMHVIGWEIPCRIHRMSRRMVSRGKNGFRAKMSITIYRG